MSYLERIVPQSVKTFWHDYRKALKESRDEQNGDNDISQGAELAGWGVKEAQEKNTSEASKEEQPLYAPVPNDLAAN